MPSTPDIALLCWDYAAPRGGMGRALQWMTAALRQRAEVRVLAPGVSAEDGESVASWTLRAGGHLLLSLVLPFLRLPRRSTYLVPSGPGGLLLLRRPPCVRLVVIAYHTYAQQAACVPGERWKRFFVPWERRTYRMADRVLCFSEDTRICLIEEYGVEPGRVRLLPQAVPMPVPPTVPRDPLLCLCVARLDRRKGVDVLLRAWPTVLRRFPAARLTLVGRGSLAVPEALAHSVTLLPSVSEEKMAGLLAGASVALCPAYLEGFGLACAEAMLAGAAVIASDAPGLRRLVTNKQTGLLATPGSAMSLALAISAVLGDPALRDRLAAAAFAEIRRRCDPVVAGEALRRAVIDAEPVTT